MAELYGTTPARLLADDVGDWSLNHACYQLDMLRRQKERDDAERNAKRGRSASPPKWGG